MENREAMMHEISKLNYLSKLICLFMIDMDQLEHLLIQGGSLTMWKNNFEDQERDFLKFLIEIVLELDSSGGTKTKKSSARNNSKKGTFKPFELSMSF